MDGETSPTSVDTMILVGTKLTAPTPPARLVRRSRLDDALSTAVQDPEARVVLVSAPAGSGTTSSAGAETTFAGSGSAATGIGRGGDAH